MRKLLQLFGGGVIAAVMVLIVIHIYSGNIIPALKDQAENTEVTQTMLLSTIRAYIPMALVGTVISAGIIYLLAVINGRKESFAAVFTEPFNRYDENGKKLRLLTPLMIVVILYCLIRCVVEEFLF